MISLHTHDQKKQKTLEKLRRIIACVKFTKDDLRIIGANDLSQIFTWIDTAYDVHDDVKSQIGRYPWGMESKL